MTDQVQLKSPVYYFICDSDDSYIGTLKDYGIGVDVFLFDENPESSGFKSELLKAYKSLTVLTERVSIHTSTQQVILQH